jgi:sulfate transport system permease protein
MAAARARVLPGFGLTMGYTLLYLSLIVLIPLAALGLKTATLTWEQFWGVITDARVLAAYRLSFGAAFLAALVNLFAGLLVAWVLVRYTFPAKRLVDAMVDLPFALPTAVAGIALTALYAPNGWLGEPLEKLGLKVAFTPLGIVIALIFIGLPFVVRTVQPVLEDIERELEEAARCLGATRWQTFTRVIFPALARGIGEFGSVIFIAGNIPMQSEIAPLLIIAKIEQHDIPGATAIAVGMLVISFVLLLVINGLQWWQQKRFGGAR